MRSARPASCSTQPAAVSALPGYADGWFSVQDAGAQLAAPLLEAQDGMRVLDACAAPGGKTTHLAELAALDLVALDVDAARLERVRDNLARLRSGRASGRRPMPASPIAGGTAMPFDRILADVPCTASGIVRRHPDGKWLRRETDIAGFVAQQTRLLDALWPCLKRGGMLLYATCSVFGAENGDQIVAFLERHRDALRIRLTFAGGIRRHRRSTLASAPRAQRTIRTGFSTPSSQKS